MKRTIRAMNGAPISSIAFGTMQFGGRASVDDAQQMFEACLEAGINHFDTAHVYTEGRSEEFLGRLAAVHRDGLIIATKVGYVGGAGARNMRAQFDISRKRLQMDMVDILYLHRFDPDTDLSETMACFAELQQQGLIRYVGLSNFAAWQVMKAQAVAGTLGTGTDILQPMYNLVKRQVEVEILPMCVDQNILAAPYSPLGGGLLTGKYSEGAGGRLSEDDRYAARYGLNWMHETAINLSELAKEVGVSPATLAVAWAARHPSGPTPIISARKSEQLAPSLDAVGFEMSQELYDRVSDLSPKPAPATDRLEEQ